MRLALTPWLDRESPYLLTFPFLMIVGVLLGTGPVLMALAIAILATEIWLIEPIGTIKIESITILRALLLVLSALYLSLIGQRLRQAVKRAQEKAQALEQAEQQTTQLDRQLRFLTESNLVGIGFGCSDGSVTYVNDEMLRMMGRSRQDFEAGQINWRDAIAPEYLHVNQEALDDLQAHGVSRGYEKAFLRPDGGRTPFLGAATRIAPDQDLHLSLAVDLTRIKQMESALRRNEASYRLLFENNPQPMWVYDLQTLRFLAVNHAAETHYGYSRDEFLAMTIADIRPKEDIPRLMDVAHKIEQKTLEHAGVWRHLKKDGTEIEAQVTAHVLDYQGRRAAVVLALDVTEQRRAEKRLNESREHAEVANAAKDRFLAILSHELRTPLTPVLLVCQSLLEQGNLTLEQQNDIAMVRRNIEMEVRLIDDLLDLNRVTRGKIELQRTAVDVNEAVERVVAMCAADARAKSQAIELRLSPQRPFIWADTVRFQQVLLNLLKNSQKFTPAGGLIRIDTEPDHEGLIMIKVIDSGIGMQPEIVSRIFNAFEQGDENISRQFGGMGLGLSISKAIVELHGGSISAHSDGMGKGSLFTVRLPVCAKPIETPNHAAIPAGAGPSGPMPRILLVEDHVDTAEMTARLLRRTGCQVQAVHTVSSALNLLESESFDVLISDVGLPDGTGHELIRQAREKCGIHGIALSGYGSDQDIAKSLEAGFSEHMIKPVSPERLQSLVHRIIARHTRTSSHAIRPHAGQPNSL